MVRTRLKWKCIFFVTIILFNVFTKSLPINTHLHSLTSTDTSFKISEIPIVIEPIEGFPINNSETIVDSKNVTFVEVPVNATRDFMFRQNIRPGQQVRSYALEITINGDRFEGRAVLDVVLTPDTREDDIILHIDGLSIKSVKTGVFSAANAIDADFDIDDQELSISPANVGSSYFVVIEYDAPLAIGGFGLHLGRYNQE